MITLWGKQQAAPKRTSARYILGLAASSEGSAAVMLKDGAAIFSAFEPPPAGGAASFPSAAVSSALEQAAEAEGEILGVKDLAAVAFCGKPLREHARLRKEWLASAPAGFSGFLDTAPAAFGGKKLAEGRLLKELGAASWGETPAALLYPEHQLSCAAAAFFSSPFDVSAILVLDGPGDGPAASICLGSGEKIKVLRELDFPDSPQLFASALAAYAGYPGDSAAELFSAPPAADEERSAGYFLKMIEELAVLKEDGSLRLDRRYFSASSGMKPDLKAWKKLFGFGPRSGGEQSPEQLDFAAAARSAVEELVYRLGAQAKRLAFSGNLCVFASPGLRRAAEGKLKASGLFNAVWSRPGTAPEARAAGAALAARHVYLNMKRPQSSEAWGESRGQETSGEPESSPRTAPARPLPGTAKLGYALYYFLALAPSAAAGREKPGDGKENPSSFYAARARIYAREDLEGAG